MRRWPTIANVFIMGQGVDDFKGIFGSTTGLAEKYGAARVFDVPLMEEGMTGVAIGAALVGDYPITTHIRADFSFLAMNQIINLAAKYRYMFGGLMRCPMLIRIVVGRSWGQGAQHSQSPQSTFAHYPGLTVVMPSSSQAILDMYPAIINRHPGPVISIEHRLLYNLDFTVSPSEQVACRSPATSRARAATSPSSPPRSWCWRRCARPSMSRTRPGYRPRSSTSIRSAIPTGTWLPPVCARPVAWSWPTRPGWNTASPPRSAASS